MNFKDLTRRVGSLHSALADAIGNPSRVWCKKCGHTEPVDSAYCFKHGRPSCCGYTMTIDNPEGGK